MKKGNWIPSEPSIILMILMVAVIIVLLIMLHPFSSKSATQYGTTSPGNSANLSGNNNQPQIKNTDSENSKNYSGPSIFNLGGSTQSSNSETFSNITEANLPQYLMSLSIIKNLSDSARIEFRTTNNTYKIIGQTVSPGTLESPDIIIGIPSSYISQFSSGFCSTFQKAHANGDVTFELKISEFEAALKYSSLYEDKSCFGL